MDNNAIIWIREDGEYMVTMELKTIFDFVKESSKKSKEKENNTDLATDRQIKYLQDLGIDPPEKVTKEEAKILIQETLNKKKLERNDNPDEPKEEAEEIEEYPDY